MKAIKPISDFSDYKNSQKVFNPGPGTAWAAVLDQQYGIEVVRELPIMKNSTREGSELRIFDLDKDDTPMVFRQKINISFGAVFGLGDVSEWQDIAMSYVDNNNE